MQQVASWLRQDLPARLQAFAGSADGLRAPRVEDIGIIVAGGPGTHSIYVPVGNNSRSVTREIITSDHTEPRQ